MIWKKKGLLYKVDNFSEWAYSHCHKPTPIQISEDTLRVYFGVREKNTNRTRTTFVDLDITDLENISVKYFHESPVLDLGKIGAFDDSGANVCSLIRNGDEIYMYYIGWNPSTTVHTRNSIGIAVSRDHGITFERLYDGPILDRNKDEPYYTGAVDVIKVGNIYKMYYTSGTEWKIINGRPEIKYHIKYATSKNGIDWQRDHIDCILPEYELEVTARPCVIYENGKYKMWYSKRRMDGFRTDSDKGYRGGYAESKDGIHWTRMDHLFGLKAGNEGEWDSQIAYPYVIKIKNRYVMFYNGNGFGKSGFGYAILEDDGNGNISL